jgi:lysophospholipase L1-like esterase
MKRYRKKMLGLNPTGSHARVAARARHSWMHHYVEIPFVRRRAAVPVTLLWLAVLAAGAQAAEGGKSWVASWTAAQQGAFVAPSAPAALAAPGAFHSYTYYPQPDVIRFALPNGIASDQTFRMIVRPDLWGDTIRVRFSNVFGKEALHLGPASAGLQEYSANVIPGTSVKLTFNGGQADVSIPPGERVFSDPVRLPFFTDAGKYLLRGRNLAVSFSVQGTNGALSYHGTAFTTSYISRPNSGDHAGDDSGAAFSYSTSSWFVLDAVDVMAPEGTAVMVALGDSITDGTFSTPNGNDRWPDFLSHRLHAIYGDKVSLVNESITGNAVVSASNAVGEPAVKRLERDVLGVSGVGVVILMEGTNDLGSARNKPEPVIEGYKQIVDRLHAAGIPIVAATLTPSYRPDQDFSTSPLGTEYGPIYGGPQTNEDRKKLNEFLRTSGIFNRVVDMEAATQDPATGVLREEFVPNSAGGPGDYLHPNRGGYQAMGDAVDPAIVLLAGQKPK